MKENGKLVPLQACLRILIVGKLVNGKKENKNRITLLILEISNSKGCLYHGSCGQQHTDFVPLSGKLVMCASPFPRPLGKGKNNFGR